MFRSAADPIASMERIYERMNETEAAILRYDAQGWTFSARAERKRLAGLRSARTRLINQIAAR